MQKNANLIVIFFGVLAFGFGSGLIIGKILGSNDESGRFNASSFFSSSPSFELLREGIDVIEEMYVESEKVEEEDLIYGAMEGMIKALGDPHSTFLKPKLSKIFEENINGSFEGIGAEITIKEGVLTIVSPLKNSPAERAGVKSGDRVLYIDDTATDDLALDEAIQIIRGPKGEKVVLTIERNGVDGSIKIAIVRDTIKIPSTEWEEKEGRIGYVALYQFTESASADFNNLANEILKSDVEKIILDLRNNPGGLLEVSVDIAGWFLDPGMVVAEERGVVESGKFYKTRGNGALSGYPLVILVNKGSASASEILAGALKDHRGVQLIGESTFGKGSVQQLVKLSDGSNIKITVAKWFTPSGISIDGNGLEPDIKVDMTQEIFESKGDIQLEKAIEALKEL
ncbi:MAG: hypothetical protein A2827_02160 [Candidatus Spechtbacteria bacterium RIFCSPHIGHO2_01_FULL_43_30]|uniref:PDZ domain-containing protein n=1 Tax=Candidatus Spechtbacteria bacterium RIFCSPHIGHO2_01_FULL_43_30 TaxID=1802158 RepID=A0A1G2H456_9BACT|nr:MAG: hypothetical protein A2827_02160 [Candidatus Spechtbacteria bacterium RIFCSPHIGHO2_01_FULL_43_30]